MIAEAARELDRLGQGESPVHRLDARVKLLAAAALVLSAASFGKREVAGLVPLAALPVLAGAAGGVPLRPVARLLLAGSPFALLVGIAAPLLDAAPAAWIGGVAVRGGWLTLLSILLRYLVSAGAALVLVGTTSLPRLAGALRELGLPATFAAQIQLLHRYVFLLADEGRRLGQARLLREPARRLPRLRTARRMLAALLLRALDRGERVYRAMAVRGFAGDLPGLAPPPLRAADAVWGAAAVLFCAGARLLPLAGWIGAAVLGGPG